MKGPAEGRGLSLAWLEEGDAVEGEIRWWITPWGSHFWVGGTVEKPIEKPVFDPDTVRKLVNGKVYFPAGTDDSGREVVVIEPVDLRRWAAENSEVVGQVKKDQKVIVAYWCFGDEEDDEYVWWVLKPADGSDPITNGARLHAVYTYQRPV